MKVGKNETSLEALSPHKSNPDGIGFVLLPDKIILQKNKMSEVRMTEDEERKLIESLKKLPDFECFPLPLSWYKKHNLEFPAPMDAREFMKSNYAMKMALEKKDLPPIVIKEPQKDKDGKVKLIEPFPLDDKPLEVKARVLESHEIPQPISL